MKHILVDTNVILDFLLMRKGFYEDAEKVMNAGFKKIITIYTPTHSLANIFYILKQSNSYEKTIEKVQALALWFTLLPVDDAVISLALSSPFKDFEDAIFHYSAIHQRHIKHIVTRNKKDFKYGNLSLLTPKELIRAIKTKP